MQILIADDNDINRRFLRGVLEPEPVTVAEAVNGREALELCAQTRFDLILMDIRMPEVDGIEATRRIRELPGHGPGACRIIALTADLRLKQEQDLLRRGFDACLVKPVDRATLMGTLQPFLPAEQARGASPGKGALDLQAALAAAGGNRELVAKLAGMLDRELDRFLPQMREALAAGRADELREMAHKLRGSAGYVGAGPLQQAAEQLEQSIADGGDAEAALRTLDTRAGDLKAELASLQSGP